MSSIESWIILQNIPHIGPSSFNKLLEHFESPENVLQAKEKDLLNIGVNSEAVKSIIINKNKIDISKHMLLLKKESIKLIRIIDKEYPLNLKSIFCPPPVIYVKGEIKEIDQVAIAVVGARMATVYGKAMTQKLCKELAYSGITVVSGMARGIDSVAHQTMIESDGRTIAVLGCGVDIIYPPENKNLYRAISEHGAVISEFPLGTKPEKFNFPRRNRLISGLSLGTLVIEAGEKSGSLITANYALEEGREVFAVPGNVLSKQSSGTNNLIKRGEAKLVENAEGIIEELEPIVNSIGKDLQKRIKSNNEKIILSQEEQKIFDLLDESIPTHIDKILSESARKNLSNIFSLMLTLELKGIIKQLPGKNFIKLIR